MSIELKIPNVGESVHEVQIARWLKGEGDEVAQDETVVELDTDKASLDLPAPAAGVLTKIVKHEGDAVSVGEVIAHIDENGKAEATPQAKADQSQSRADADKEKADRARKKPPAKRESPPKKDGQASQEAQREESSRPGGGDKAEKVVATPAARRELRRHGLTAEQVPVSGNRLRPEDVQRFVESQKQAAPQPEASKPQPAAAKVADEEPAEVDELSEQLEEIVPMSLIRRRIGQKLVEAQHKAALLSTFNEIDMSTVIALRKEHRERFLERYGVKLGFMSFFVKAVIDALKQQPELNAEIRDETKIAYRHHYDIGIAIGGGKGLVVPVLRRAERMSFAEIEQAIDDFARRAEANKLQPDELAGGTFTISNGGIYGSLLSTPIVNPPQSGVLGMHAIQDRPIAVGGQVVIRPMMYVALTYDHRLVDGREAVLFLVRVKQAIEEPSRMLLEV